MACIMNNFFAGIGPKLAAEIPNLENITYVERLNNGVAELCRGFEFTPVNSDYVLEKLTSITEKKEQMTCRLSFSELVPYPLLGLSPI